MSLLWSQAARHEAMPWTNEGGHHPVVHSVRKAGFAGYTHDRERLAADAEEDGKEPGGFDEDLWDEHRPDLTPEEEAHNDEHGEPPESFYDRHQKAYDKALRDKELEDDPDNDDPELINFIHRHGGDTKLWKKHGTEGPVDLRQPVHATQSHVSQTHIDKYHDDPGSEVHRWEEHPSMRGQFSDEDSSYHYLGDHTPLFVTHKNRLHTIEGHHRVAAALQRGDHSIHAWHYDLDHNPGDAKTTPEDDDEDY